MANTLDPMDIKQVFSLHADGLSNRRIADILGLSRNTINRYISWLKASDYAAKELVGMEDGVVKQLFPSRTTIKNERYDALMCHFEQIRKAQEHPGFTFLHHYAAYSEAVADPYSYTQFMEHYNRKYKKEKGSMKLDHIPGNEIYIDFAGKKLSIVNKLKQFSMSNKEREILKEKKSAIKFSSQKLIEKEKALGQSLL